MKNLKQLSVLFFSLLIFSSFSTDPKLTQGEAQKTLSVFVIMHNNPGPGVADWKVILLDVLKTDLIRQSSSKEAYFKTMVAAKVAVGDPTKQCYWTETVLTIDFHFELNKKNKWTLEGINTCTSEVKVNEDHLRKLIEKNRGLNILAD